MPLAGAEAAGLGHGGSVTELAGQCVWFVGVASERDCCSALVAPTPDDLRAERRSVLISSVRPLRASTRNA